MKTKRTTSLSFNEDDYVRHLELNKLGHSIIDTWRLGAEQLLKQEKEKK